MPFHTLQQLNKPPKEIFNMLNGCHNKNISQNMEIYNYFSIKLTEELIISRINPESLKYKREILSRLSEISSLEKRVDTHKKW